MFHDIFGNISAILCALKVAVCFVHNVQFVQRALYTYTPTKYMYKTLGPRTVELNTRPVSDLLGLHRSPQDF